MMPPNETATHDSAVGGQQPSGKGTVADVGLPIQMAHNAGVKAVGVTYGNGSRKEMEEENTEWIIDDFAEMIGVCNSFL
jgi:hypothetical protein